MEDKQVDVQASNAGDASGETHTVKHVDMGSPYEALKSININSAVIKARQLAGHVAAASLQAAAAALERIPVAGRLSAIILYNIARYFENARQAEAAAMASRPAAVMTIQDGEDKYTVLVPHGGGQAVAVNQRDGTWSIVTLRHFKPTGLDDVLASLGLDPDAAARAGSQLAGAAHAFLVDMRAVAGKMFIVGDNGVAVDELGNVARAFTSFLKPTLGLGRVLGGAVSHTGALRAGAAGGAAAGAAGKAGGARRVATA